jgi:hypothetical protein
MSQAELIKALCEGFEMQSQRNPTVNADQESTKSTIETVKPDDSFNRKFKNIKVLKRNMPKNTRYQEQSMNSNIESNSDQQKHDLQRTLTNKYLKRKIDYIQVCNIPNIDIQIKDMFAEQFKKLSSNYENRFTFSISELSELLDDIDYFFELLMYYREVQKRDSFVTKPSLETKNVN